MGILVQSVSDTLNPHKRPFPGMLDRHPRLASGRSGCFLSLLLAGGASFLWFCCQWFVPMVTDSASWPSACRVRSRGS